MSVSTRRSDTSDLFAILMNGARLTRIFWPTLQITVDLLSIIGAAVLSGILYSEWTFGEFGNVGAFFAGGVVMALVHNSIRHLMDGYPPQSRRTPHAVLVFYGQWGLTFVLIACAARLVGVSKSMLWDQIGIFFFIGLWALSLGRLVLFFAAAGGLEGEGLMKPSVILIREDRPFPRLEHCLARLRVAVHTITVENFSIHSEKWDTLVHALHAAYLSSRAQVIYIAAPLADAADVARMIDALSMLPLPAIGFIPTSGAPLFEKYLSNPDEFVVVTVKPATFSHGHRALKRAMDFMLAGVGAVLFLPLMLIIAVMIKIDTRGPIFFRQTRYGRGRKPFKIWKFRTMTVLEDGPVIAQAQQQDPRVTRVGRILRRTSLDEIPQLFNVITGEMSLVGPRPHACAHDDQYVTLISDYMWRQHVKPGITGWAQIHGSRGETRTLDQMRRRIELDCWYMRNWSVTLDISILAQTLIAIVRDDAAY